MGKSLVIVESPAKAKTINKYLGKDFIVKSSVGHVRDLPVSGGARKKIDPVARAQEAAKTRKMDPDKKEAYKKQKARASLIARMGIDPEHDWIATYEILPGKEKVVDELKKLAKDADHIYLATDMDREGEAIAWHLQEVIGGDDSRYKRVVFNEITQTAIAAAFDEPGMLDISRVYAQQTRRFLDRVVGYMVSPLLWAKVARGLSAGRVQSVAVRILVEREREIRAFNPEEFWEIFADTETKANIALRLQVVKCQNDKFRPINEEQAQAALKVLQTADFDVIDREDKPTRSRAPAPFITSTLQQAASTRLNFGVKKTMMLAQRLYEAGYISYMRTDSTNLSAEAVESCRVHILEDYGKKYLPKDPIIYGSKEGAQEAHEAIRPSDVKVKSTQLMKMDRDAERLYELIWRRFVACQMTQAEFLSSNITVKAGDYELKTRGRIQVFDGHLLVQPSSGKDEDLQLPDVKIGERLALNELDPKQHFTKPPARFTEASLVKELEKNGIGRPSTYAAIISTIQDRGYVRVESRRFFAEKMGEIVTDRLYECFSHLMDYNFTADMESTLDKISSGEVKWRDVLDEFYKDFHDRLTEAQKPDGGMRENNPIDTDIECPTCQRTMQLRTASTGVFLGCSGYALPPKERCTKTINLISGEEVETAGEEDAETEALMAKRRCPKCDTAMENYLIDESRKLHVCGNSPDCKGIEIEAGQFKIKGYDGPLIECDKCGDDMELKSGRFGKYFGCNNEECKNTRKLLRSGEAAPPKADPVPMPHLQCEKNDDFYLLRDGAAGIFLAASQFPKHRETRAPKVKEIVSVKDQLDPKFKYLTTAPTEDPDGNCSIIRYSRKTKEQYVMSEVEGKATGWRAFYNGSQWKEEAPAPAKKVAKKKVVKKKAAIKKKTVKKKAAKKKILTKEKTVAKKKTAVKKKTDN